MYLRRRHRPRVGNGESFQALRLKRKLDRRRTERVLFLCIILGPVAFLCVYQLGRSWFYMREVAAFVQAIEQLKPAEVKRETQRFAQGLTSVNPLVRNGSMAAVKVATGWRLGNDAAEWKRWWDNHEPHWQYRPRGATNEPAPATVDWRKDLPEFVSPPVTNPSPAAPEDSP